MNLDTISANLFLIGLSLFVVAATLVYCANRICRSLGALRAPQITIVVHDRDNSCCDLEPWPLTNARLDAHPIEVRDFRGDGPPLV